jgi:glycosyltransferase involved in cell wall biosynthesis
MNDAPTAVIIPAHNEEAVIERTLTTLLRSAKPGEFLVYVVCNGCGDETAKRVRNTFPEVTVLELTEASKTVAINAGLRASRAARVLLLDADIELCTQDARSLTSALDDPAVDAAIGHMEIDDSDSCWAVKSFYRIWAHQPYLKDGKFAAAIALSRSVLDRIGELPKVTADDTYLRQMISKDHTVVLDQVRFRARVPKLAATLIRVRARVHRGNRELRRHLPDGSSPPAKRGWQFAGEISKRPALWLDVPCYLAIAVASRFLAAKGPQSWERDLTTRNAVN